MKNGYKRGGNSAVTVASVSDAVEKLCTGAYFPPKTFALPAENGAQISMSGEILASGNGGSLGYDAPLFRESLRSFPSMSGISDSRLDYFIKRGRYTALCGDSDRGVAMLGAVSALMNLGISKILVCADTGAERDSSAEALRMLRYGSNGVPVTVYGQRKYKSDSAAKLRFAVYGFLTSCQPEIMIMGRDSFCRANNILRRGGDASLAALMAKASPAVLVTSDTVEGARTLSRCASVFSPVFTLAFAGGNPKLLDAVIFRSVHSPEVRRRKRDTEPEQLSLE